MRPVRVVETSVGDLPVLTLQDPSDVQGCFGLRLSASVAPCVIESEWYWPVVGASYSSISQCGCASPGGWTSD